MFIPTRSSARWGFSGHVIAILLVVSGCSQSSNPVGSEIAAADVEPQSEQIALEIPEEALEALKQTEKRERPGSIMAKSGGDVVAYTFDDLDVTCLFNTAFPTFYRDLEFSDSRLLARCSLGGGVALVPTDLAGFNAGTVARNLITLPSPASAVSIEAIGIRNLGPRNFVAYDAAGIEIDRATFIDSSERVSLTVTGEIHQVAIIDYQAQTFWDDLTVTYGVLAEPPVADAGPDQQIIVTERAKLAGTASSDPDNDALIYLWTWTATPGGTQAVFSNPNAAVTTFTADLPGTYTAQLIAKNGSAESAPDAVDIVALTLSEAVTVLGEDVSSLQAEGFLNGGQTKSLLKMLDSVQRMVDKKPRLALKKLNAFTGHVSGLVEEGVLSPEQGDALIHYATRIAAIEKLNSPA